MIENIFLYDNAVCRLSLNNPEILLVKEFSELVKKERNICKEDPTGESASRAFREFTYIYLAIDWKSPYADYSEQERHKAALNDANLTESEWNNPEFRAACRKYRDLQESNRSIKMLKAAQNMSDKITDYLNNLDPEERDPVTGKYMNKVKDIQTEMSNLSKIHEELKSLEALVRKDLKQASTIRGGAVVGFENY